MLHDDATNGDYVRHPPRVVSTIKRSIYLSIPLALPVVRFMMEAYFDAKCGGEDGDWADIAFEVSLYEY